MIITLKGVGVSPWREDRAESRFHPRLGGAARPVRGLAPRFAARPSLQGLTPLAMNCRPSGAVLPARPARPG